MSLTHTHSPGEVEEDEQAISPSTNVTTPDLSPGAEDDIWASDNDQQTHTLTSNRNNDTNNGELLSDLPTIKRQHMTDGYREGLSVGKARVMQSGFDDGYPIGVQIAMRAGKIVGVLEGCLASKSVDGGEGEERKAEVRKLYDAAKRELACTKLLDGMRDDVVAEAKGVPEGVEVVLERWEERVFGRVADGVAKKDEGA
jgi:hypothetical protein